MASNESEQDAGGALKDELLFTIEASVVTGFEETARGEAKELFNTDVKAARGKITWSIPYNRIQDVLKMGSIDNFKVLIHSVKPFHFTDQLDSLARLQKMVADVDWESGLKVWRLFNDFPHPIPPHQEVVPSPEDLVEVVIMNNLPAKKGKEEKKYKKGGNWKKKKASKGGRESNSDGKITVGYDGKLEPDCKTEQSRGDNTWIDYNLSLDLLKLEDLSTKENFEVKPLDETGANVEVKPLDETGLNVEVKPFDETGLNVEVKPFDETGVNVEVKPLDETDVNIKCKPLDETGANVKVKPFDETGVNVEVKPLDETGVNVKVKPFDETGVNVEVKPLDETDVNVEVKPLDETGANDVNVEVKSLEETGVNVEVKPLVETGVNVEVKPLVKTGVEVKLFDDTLVDKVEVKPFKETEVNKVEVKSLAEAEVNKVGGKNLEVGGESVEFKLLDDIGANKVEAQLPYIDVKPLVETEVESVEVNKKEAEKAETVMIIADCKSLEDLEVSNVEVKLQCEELETEATPVQVAERNMYIQEPKTVIIKRREDWDKDTKIDIKVLLPNPEENIFPSKLRDRDDRIVEPMDIDLSVSNANFAEDCTDKSKAMSVTKQGIDGRKDIPSEGHAYSLSETEFASSIIKRLTSPPGSQVRTFESEDSPQNTGTPPPTPTHYTASLPGVNFVRDGPMADSLPAVNEQSSELPGESAEQSQADGVGGSKTPPVNTSGLSLSPSSGMENQLIQDSAKIAARTIVLDPTKPKFRVTCNRNGDYHPFNSPTAAASFGSAVNRYHKWIVDLNNFDIEVILDIDHEEVSVGLGLTKTSLHKRNLVVFGPTTLRATICYNMLRLCRIKNGDIICDPMCGSGALPIEGAVSWTKSFHLGGDNHKRAIERTAENVTAIQNKMKEEYNRRSLNLDIVQWDIEHFPLREKTVDVFISDLPFGHGLGNRAANRTLYPNLLTEMARTASTGARACLLTEDKANFIRAVNNLGKFWQRRLVLNINIGGLSGFVFLLTRTSTAFRCGMEAWNDTSNVMDSAADLGYGDSCKVPAADNTVTGSTEPAHFLKDDPKICAKDSSQENSVPAPCEGNLFCD